MNKLFKLSRIGAVDLLDAEWQYQDRHSQGFIDVFRMTGFEQHRVQLRLGMLARNLLIEEYPLAERDITQEGKGCWMLDTKVCNYLGVGRFVMGLMDDIEIVDTPELSRFVEDRAHHILQKI